MRFKFIGTSPGNFAENHFATVTDGYIDRPLKLRRMPLSYQVHFSVSFKLGNTWRNQRRVVTTATDHRRGIVV